VPLTGETDLPIRPGTEYGEKPVEDPRGADGGCTCDECLLLRIGTGPRYPDEEISPFAWPPVEVFPVSVLSMIGISTAGSLNRES
jgi:hypothetical protein